MPPGIAEVIFVQDAWMRHVIEVEIAQGDLGRLQYLSVRVDFRGADDEASDDELMQVGVGPAEGGLDHLVELGEVEPAGQQEPPPETSSFELAALESVGRDADQRGDLFAAQSPAEFPMQAYRGRLVSSSRGSA